MKEQILMKKCNKMLPCRISSAIGMHNEVKRWAYNDVCSIQKTEDRNYEIWYNSYCMATKSSNYVTFEYRHYDIFLNVLLQEL
jgi:hypothetical protein